MFKYLDICMDSCFLKLYMYEPTSIVLFVLFNRKHDAGSIGEKNINYFIFHVKNN